MAFECHQGTNTALNLSKEDPFDQEIVETHVQTSQIDAQLGLEASVQLQPIVGVGSSDKLGTSVSLCGPELKLPSIFDLPLALISEILKSLDPKELALVGCVSTILHKLSSEHIVWKKYYTERWGLPATPKTISPELGAVGLKTWKELFVEKEYMSKIFMGRYNVQVLHGHSEAVRAVFLLVAAKLVFTSGYDSIVRMWDMEEGSALGSSLPLGCTIRAVTADQNLLVAGGTDSFIHCWKATEGLQHLFEMKTQQNQNAGFRLWEHEGPITCLGLDATRLYSGSWDMTIRVWDRYLFECVQVLRHSDWVWSLALLSNTVASTSGSDLYLWDTTSYKQLALVQKAHVGNSFGLARSCSGDLLFTGGEDGAIHMFELTIDGNNECHVYQVVSWFPHTGPVYALAFEYPWLVSASSDGKLALMDVRVLLKARKHKLKSKIANSNIQKHQSKIWIEPPQRMLHGFGCNLFSVGIGAQHIVCGGEEEGVVRIWNFSRALEIEQRARALRGIRLENRMRRRKLQTEMIGKAGRSDQCLVVAKKNPPNGDKSNSIWHHKRGVSGKLKA